MLIEGLKNIVSVLEIVLGLGLLIFIHEFGHFLMAKRNKVRVEIFSLGFGWPIFRWRRGETEYRIAWIPLGGFVKMSGETLTDERKGEPWELTSKGAWPRFQIFVAGATMNLLIAFPISVLTFLVGRYEVSNEVGSPGVSESYAGMQPGDVVVDVDGRRIESLEKYRIELLRRPVGRKVPVKVLRNGEEKNLLVESRRSSYHDTRPPSLMVGGVKPGSPAEKAGLKEYDLITFVDGRRIFSGRDLVETLLKSPGKPVEIRFQRRDSAWNVTEHQAVLTPPAKKVYAIPEEQRIYECIVEAALPGQPAFGLLLPDDKVIRAGDREIGNWQDFKDVVEPAPVGKPLKVTVERQGKPVEIEIVPAYGESGRSAVGIYRKKTNVFAQIPFNSFFEKAGLRTGDRLYSKDGVTGDLVVENVIDVRSETPKKVVLEVKRAGEPKPVPVELKAEERLEGDLEALGMLVGPGSAMAFRRRSLGDAFSAGLYEPLDVSVLTFEFLGKLVVGQESMKTVSGPVGIFKVSHRSTQLSFGNFLWLLGLITVNLGIFNLLPIPILDGGHILLLLIEKLRGRPPDERFVAGFQYVGLVLILSLIVFVTYNDIFQRPF